MCLIFIYDVFSSQLCHAVIVSKVRLDVAVMTRANLQGHEIFKKKKDFNKRLECGLVTLTIVVGATV